MLLTSWYMSKITGPILTLDRQGCHRDVTVSPGGRKFFNSRLEDVDLGESEQLQRYKGAFALFQLSYPGNYFYEILVQYKIRQPLDSCSLVLEIGLARQENIDQRHHMDGPNSARSMVIAHHKECDAICLHIAHDTQCFYHQTLTENVKGKTLSRVYGFFLDSEIGRWKILDSATGAHMCHLDGVDCSEPLVPVLAGYNPQQVEVAMVISNPTFD